MIAGLLGRGAEGVSAIFLLRAFLARNQLNEVDYAINQADERDAALVGAGRGAPGLKGITNISYVMSRVTYFERMGNTEAALQELKEASSLPETSDLVHRYALLLFELGRDPEALRVLNDRLKLKPDIPSPVENRLVVR